MGDFNLDIGRKDDVKYGKRSLLKEFLAAMSTTGLEYLPTPVTWHSYGRFQDGQVQRHSTVDHCYTLGVSATVRVLPDATTDHQPLLLFVNPARISGNSNSTKTIKSHNFKAIRVGDFESALDRTWNWGDIYRIRDVNEVHSFVLAGITAALDEVEPLKEIRV
jgi:hypothetical protein